MKSFIEFARALKLVWVCCVIWIVFGGATCGEGTEDLVLLKYKLDVHLVNNGVEDIHLYVSGETGSPNNRLQPGSSRTVEVNSLRETRSLLHIDYKYNLTLYAFRNGEVVSSKKIVFDDWVATSDDRKYYGYCTYSYPW